MLVARGGHPLRLIEYVIETVHQFFLPFELHKFGIIWINSKGCPPLASINPKVLEGCPSLAFINLKVFREVPSSSFHQSKFFKKECPPLASKKCQICVAQMAEKPGALFLLHKPKGVPSSSHNFSAFELKS